MLAPEAIPVDRLRKIGAKQKKLIRYPGLKEEYYLSMTSSPTRGSSTTSGSTGSKVITVVRPPPETSEYHERNDLYARHRAPPPGRGPTARRRR